MLKFYMGGALSLLVAGQVAAAPTADQLLDQALGDPSMGVVVDQAVKLGTLGIQPTDAAIIIALSGLAWKFLDTQQKGGTIDTFNLWLRRKLKVDGHNPPPPPAR